MERHHTDITCSDKTKGKEAEKKGSMNTICKTDIKQSNRSTKNDSAMKRYQTKNLEYKVNRLKRVEKNQAMNPANKANHLESVKKI